MTANTIKSFTGTPSRMDSSVIASNANPSKRTFTLAPTRSPDSPLFTVRPNPAMTHPRRRAAADGLGTGAPSVATYP
jgi:hypothetical protein